MEFTKRVLRYPFLVALWLLLASYNCSADERASVLILGGGAAGMAAMKQLSDKGVTDFILIEAEERLGGRVKDTKFGGKLIELGANWVQGTEGNLLWELAQKNDLGGIISDYDSYIIRDETGSDVTDEADNDYELFENAMEKVDLIRTRRKKLNDSDMTLRACLSAAGWPRRRTPVQDVIEYFDIDFEYAQYSEDCSLLNKPYGQDKFSSDEYFVTDQNGFRKVLLKEYAEAVLTSNDTRLYLNEVVQTVQYEKDRVVVRTKSGKVFVGKVAIVTFSVGVMQSNQIKFDPQIPAEKKEAFQSFQMTTYTKIFIRFANDVKRFWDDVQFMLYSSKTRGKYPIWQNLEADGLHPTGTNILLVTVTGYEAERIARMSNEEVKQEVTKTLRDMYGDRIPEPEEIIVPDWHQNPLYFGSYSNWPASVDVKTHELMSQRLENLFFAGEAYERYYYGYVHGALFSGVATADHVINYLESI